MRVRTLLCAAAAAGLVLGCDSPPDVAAPPPANPPLTLAGTYQIEGVTVDVRTGAEREISGTIVLAQEAHDYTTTFSLKTTYPSADGTADADVIGSGKGTIDGNKLRGTAETQLVMATVPGVDTQFAFIPRIVGPRIVSTTVGHVADDGTLVIEIENRPAEGETYPPTRTTMTGTRISR